MIARTASLITIAAFLLAAAAAQAVTLVGSGRSATEDRAASGFSGVALSLPARVELVQGGSESVRITADDNVLPQIESVVEGGVLKLRFRERGTSLTNARIRVIVNARTVESLAIAGAGDIHATALATRRLSVSVSGSGDVKMAGRADALEASIAGSGEIDASRLDTQRAKVSVAGSGDAVIWARQTLKVSVAGSGDIRYYGDPVVERSIVGSGSVRRLGAAPA